MRFVALDAMGGDHAPEATVTGAVLAARKYKLPLLLTGDRERLKAELEKHAPVPAEIELVHAGSVIDMNESPGPALLRKRDASVVVATELVKEGRAAAVVSIGNSGAAMGAATLRLGLIRGLERPAIAMAMPSREKGVMLLDVGATVDTRAEHLRDFALIGSVYARCLLHIEHPRVGLLNIGVEESKGNALVKLAYPLIKETPVNFIGYVEGEQLALGGVDVAVCDGFVGNAILKAIEGYGELFWSMFKGALQVGVRGQLGGWLLRPALRKVAAKLDYVTYGGALLVGVNGVCVIGHGRSSPVAVANALRVAAELADQGVVEQLTASFAQLDNHVPQAAVGQKLQP